VIKKILGLITDIMTALSNCSLYTKDHDAVFRFSEKAVGTLEELIEENELSLTVLGEQLLINDEQFKEQSLHIGNFMKRLRRNDIEKVVFKKGITPTELVDFIAALSSSTEKPESSKHLLVEALAVKMLMESADVSEEIKAGTEKICDIYNNLAKFGTLDIIGLEDVVTNFIATLQREANILRIMSPVKAHSEYTFAHTTNVTLLSIFQAKSLGMKGEILHAVGLAGLLHDVGKMFVPTKILEKKEKLIDEEWVIMKNHTVYGSMYLSSIQDVPKLAVICAFEHHMKFDGTGYPDTIRRDKIQHIISQIVSISDFFDALRTERPYRNSMEVPTIIGMMKESSGKDFNPMLVDNFIDTMKTTNII
jgi:HD-GYP domain-containing protein (c-di-GMP phosphodiesterase class II)